MFKALKSWKGVLIVFLLISSNSLQAQANYEKGYFINNDGQRTECLIRNLNWLYNPSEFEYKLTADDKAKTLRVTEVREFVIYGFAKYVGSRVKWDTSSDRLDKISDKRSPEWRDEYVFLKVLVEGEATLYSLRKDEAKGFFYKVGESSIAQLVYKKYEMQMKTVAGKNVIATNSDFLGQLNSEVRCGRDAGSKMPSLTYNAKVLAKYFSEFNKCKGGNSVNLGTNSQGDSVQDWTQRNVEQTAPIYFSVRPGLNFSAIHCTESGAYTYSYPVSYDYPSSSKFRLGLEAEFIITNSRNKWGVIVEPTYRSYSAETTGGYASTLSSVKYTSLELPVGIRRHFPLSENSNFFMNGAIVFDMQMGGSTVSSKKLFNYALGAGISVNSITLELRYFTDRELTGSNTINGNFYNTALILGIRFAKTGTKK